MTKRLVIIAWMAVAMMASTLAQAGEKGAKRPPQSATSGPAAVIVLHGDINDFSHRVLVQRFQEARDAGAGTVILDIDTNGGLVTSALEMSRFLKRQTDIHTIAYIGNKAYSAGALIAVACDEIVMGPSAVMGDSAPIAIGPTGIQPLPPAERGKAESPIITDFRDSARQNGYDEELLVAMVSVGRTVYWVQNVNNPDERRFVNEAVYKELIEGGQWKPVEEPGVPNPVDGPDTLLTVHTEQALALGLASAMHETWEDLTTARELSVIAVYVPGWGERLVGLLDSPGLRALLLSMFLVFLYASIHTPGQGFPEVLAAISFSILVGVPLLTGHAQWWEIVVILLGIAMLALEVFVIPGFGITGLAGIIMILGGLLMTFVGPEPGRFPLAPPRLPVTWQMFQEALLTVVAGLAGSLLLFWWLRRYLPRLPYANRLILTTVVGGSDAAMVGSLTNIDPMSTGPAVGAVGKALTDLRPGGSARFVDSAGGEHVVSVVSDSGFIAEQTPIVVREVAGSHIVVRAARRE
jgi:membrane-bound serine protease (ClpP class)